MIEMANTYIWKLSLNLLLDTIESINLIVLFEIFFSLLIVIFVVLELLIMDEDFISGPTFGAYNMHELSIVILH
mgnify:CR=1 FL=1